MTRISLCPILYGVREREADHLDQLQCGFRTARTSHYATITQAVMKCDQGSLERDTVDVRRRAAVR